MQSIRPVLDLLREPWLRLLSTTVNPLAPADLVLSIALRLADLRRARP